MPDFVELLKAKWEAEDATARSSVNRFFPGGTLGNTLGFIDLVLGAPARAIQGGIISGMRDQDVLSGAARSFLGRSLDTGEFGTGEVASGLELLEEFGWVKDKDNLGNVVGGVGADVLFDLATFNAIGAARRVALSAAGKGIGKIQKLGIEGARYRTFGKDFLHQNKHQTRMIRNMAVRSMDQGQRRVLFEQLNEAGGLGYKVFHETKKGRLAAKAASKKIWDWDFEGLELRYLGDPAELQAAIRRPTVEAMGRAEGQMVRGLGEVRGAVSPLTELDPRKIRVVNWGLNKNYLGTNRPANVMDVSFRDAPRFLRDKTPANMASRIPMDMVMTGKPFNPSIWNRFFPAHWNPFDWTSALRETGIMGPLLRGYNKFHGAQMKEFALVEELAKKAGIKSGTARAEVLGKVADGKLGRELASKSELQLLDGIEALEARLAHAGGLRPEHFHQGKYFHHVRTDIQQPVFRDFIVTSGQGVDRWRVDMLGDMPKGIKVGAFMRRTDHAAQIDYDVLKSARAYITAVNRKIFMEKELKSVLPDIARLNQRGLGNVYKSAQGAVQNLFGGYSVFDSWMDDLFSKIPGLSKMVGDHGHLATRMSVSLTAWVYRGMLGLNPRTSLLQVSQGVVNNTLALGMVDSVKGFFRHAGAKTGLRGRDAVNIAYRDSKVWNEFVRGLDKEFVNTFGGRGGKFMEHMDRVLFAPLQGFDNFNRGWAFHGGYSLAKRAGLSDPQALLQGIKVANETQFIYGKLGASAARSSPLGRVLLQFQSYAAKQLSFLAKSFRRDPGTNLMRYMAISGLLARNIGSKIDISKDLTPTTPGDIKNIVTMKRLPALQGIMALTDMGKAMLQEATGNPILGQAIDPGFAAEQLKRVVFTTMFPGGTMFGRFAQYLPTLTEEVPAERVMGPVRTGGRGKRIDKFGRTISDLSPAEATLGLFGFKTTESALRYEEVKDIKFAGDMMRRRKSWYLTEAVRAIENGRDPSPFLIEAQKITLEPIDKLLSSVRQRLANRQMTLRRRTWKRAHRTVKEQYSP